MKKKFVYQIVDNTVMFFTNDKEGMTFWSDNPQAAHNWNNPTDNLPLSDKFIEENPGTYSCIGSAQAIINIHQQGPQIGQKVTVRNKGKGIVVGYAKQLPNALTHVVQLDEDNSLFHAHVTELELV